MLAQVLPFIKLPALQPSVEPTVWVQAKFIAENFPYLSWFGNWYAGFPFRFSGPPALVYLLAFLHKVTGVSIPTLDGIISALSLSFLTVGVYFLANFLTKNKLTAFIAASLFLVLPSVGYIFPQAAAIGADFGFLPWRISGFLTFGGGAKLAGFAILPFIILLFWQTINKFSRKNFILIVGLTLLLLLTDLSAFISFLVFIAAILAAEAAKGEWVVKLGRTSLIVLTAFGLSAFWYTPSYILNILASPSLTGASFAQIVLRLFQFALVAVPVFLAVFGFWARKLAKEEIFVILSLGFFGFLTLLWWATDSDFLALYSRFFTEIDIVIALFSGLIIQKCNKKLLQQQTVAILSSVLAILIIILGVWFRFSLVNLTKFDLESSVEKKIANWLQEHASPTDRVYLSGSTAFWLNWAAPSLAQIRGGVDQAATHPFAAHASFNLREGEDAATALAWLKALRVKYVVVHDENSAEYYGDFKNPEKFTEIGKAIFDNKRGDKIFQINTPGVAQIVKSEILKTPKPKNGADFANLQNYVDFLDRGRGAEANWVAVNKLIVKAQDLKSEEGISLSVTYDPAWTARSMINHQSLAIEKDPIGNIFVDVQDRVLNMQGVEIVLEHSPRWDNWVGYAISVFTLFLIARPKYAKRLYSGLPKLHFGLEEEE